MPQCRIVICTEHANPHCTFSNSILTERTDLVQYTLIYTYLCNVHVTACMRVSENICMYACGCVGMPVER